MALGLGVGISKQASQTATTAVQDYFFQLSGSDLQPKDSFSDFSRTWDLDTNGNITPASSPKSEGYFETDSDGNVQPYS